MKKTVVGIYEVREDRSKKHYKSITIPRAPVTVWRLLKPAFLPSLDLEALRQQRKRKGGK